MDTDLIINETCWICGAQATTREHIVKKSLLKLTFGEADKAYLIYEDGVRKTMQSPDSKHIKYRKNLCLRCNSSLTQPFDRTYDEFIRILQDNKNNIIKNKYIDLRKLNRNEREDLFRYFAKEFGCKINHERLTVPECIKDMMQGKQYGKILMLLFYINTDNKKLRIEEIITQSRIDCLTKNKSIVYQYDASLGWLMYIACYTSLPKQNIRKINNKSKTNPWLGKRKKILLRRSP